MDYERLRAEIERELWKCYEPFRMCDMTEVSHALIDLIKAEAERGLLSDLP